MIPVNAIIPMIEVLFSSIIGFFFIIDKFIKLIIGGIAFNINWFKLIVIWFYSYVDIDKTI
jgi:hypothetical protein